jgi:hypothetical protein
MQFSLYTALYNVTGQPSNVGPLHWTPDSLPVGVMFSGRFGEDAIPFRLAAQLEKAQPWDKRKTPFKQFESLVTAECHDTDHAEVEALCAERIGYMVVPPPENAASKSA